MNAEPSSPLPLAPRRRYLAVWFPWLPSERLARDRPATATPPDTEPRTGKEATPAPTVLVEKIKGALRLAAVSPAAARAGLAPGMSLADARARLPDLDSQPHRPDLDQALLEAALEDFGRFTPMLALDTPHGLILDVTGCAHLFGDEAGLVRAVETRARKARLTPRWALAASPQAARALSRFGSGGIHSHRETRAAVRDLGVAALELDPREEQALNRAGLKRISDLDDRPRAPLAARFGSDFPARLARILGAEDIRITPHRPPPPVVVDRVFFEPIAAPEDVERVLADLMLETVDRLDQMGQGGRAFQAGFYRVDGVTRRITVRTGRPTRDVATVLRLFRERFGALTTPLDPGFGYDQLRMAVPEIEPLAPSQKGLIGANTPLDEELGRLIDRLSARLGPGAVMRLEPRGSHMPERAVRAVPAAAPPAKLDWPALHEGEPPLRPLHLFTPPQPVETMAEIPDGTPLRFRWRRVLHEVIRAEGPERIAGEWWRSPDQKTRDYYRVEDREGRRFWLFRQGLYGDDSAPRWFIHGLFA